MAWTGLTLTVDGRNALNQAQFDNQLNFKSIVVGDGKAPANFRTQKQLVHQLYELMDLKIDKTESGCTLTADFPKVDYDYYFREVGIIVTTKEGDKLYVYDNCGEDAQYIVSSTGAETTQKRLRLALVISDVENITVSEPSILYVAYDDYEQAVLKLNQTKVDKVEGKGLSTNDYTTEEKNKLSGIATGAEINVQADWNETNTKSDAYIKNKPKTMKNPNALDIKLNGVSQGVYDGSSQKNVNITAEKVGADSSGTAETKVSEHNASEAAHADIRELITNLATRLNALADSDDTTLDQLSEIVAYIKSNRSLIENITTKKVNVDDIVDNLTSSAANKVLSANQGKVLKDLIDTLTSNVEGKADGSNGVLTNATFQGTQATFLCPQQVKVMSGEAGKDGYIILARIKIIGLYNGYPIAINFSQRGWGDTRTLYVRFQDTGDTTDVNLSSFYINRSISDYIGIAKIDTATWEIYVRKSQDWTMLCVHSYYVQSGMYEVSFPGTQITTLPDGCVQPQVIKYQASEILDDGNNNAIKVSYSKDGLDSANWFAAWNGYELRAISPNSLRDSIDAVSRAGDTMTGDLGIPVGRADKNMSALVSGYLENPLDFSKFKSFIGSYSAGDGDWNIISVRHKNGYDDGNLYGMYFKNKLTSEGNLIWGQQTGLDKWSQEKTILDSVNYKDFCLPLSGGKMTGEILIPYSQMPIFENDYGGIIAGGSIVSDNLTDLSNYRSFVGTHLNKDGQWNHVISERHHNGFGDGNLYGLRISSPITTSEDERNLYWSTQNTNWAAERTILDSYNYKKYYSYEKLIAEDNACRLSLLSAMKERGDCGIEAYTKSNGKTSRIRFYNGRIFCEPYDQFVIDLQVGNSLKKYTFDDVGFWAFSSEANLGTSAFKWNNIYAANGTIQTSDKAKKKNIKSLDIERIKAFIMGLIPCSYEMIDGTSGRTHWGFISQYVEELMKKLGMTSKDFAGFIKSPKKVIKYEEYEDKNGNKFRRPIEQVIDGEYEYGLRYEEFIAPLIKVVQEHEERIEKQQETIDKQQKTIDNQQKEIEELKKELKELKEMILKAA